MFPMTIEEDDNEEVFIKAKKGMISAFYCSKQFYLGLSNDKKLKASESYKKLESTRK